MLCHAYGEDDDIEYPDLHISALKRMSSKHDCRSLASEEYAFRYLGIRDVVAEEDALIDRYASMGLKVPEMIALDPLDPDRIISVEVKRICGNQLPIDEKNCERRKLKRRNHYIWPWEKTICNSMMKAHSQIVTDMKIYAHHIVFVIPSSLDRRALRRMCIRIQESCYSNIGECAMELDRMFVHVIQGDDSLFDRF